VASFALKLLPESINNKFPSLIKESSNKLEESNKLVKIYMKSKEAKVSALKKPTRVSLPKTSKSEA
jgi:hypothetical protein